MVLPIAKLFRGSRTSELHRKFHAASSAASKALETADCLMPLQDRPSSAGPGGIELSKQDWFELYGLHEVARKGACTTSPPPWWTHKSRWKWQAWRAQGDLAPAEARLRFVEAIGRVPGFVVPAEPVDGCGRWIDSFLSCASWLPCFTSPAAAPAEPEAITNGADKAAGNLLPFMNGSASKAKGTGLQEPLLSSNPAADVAPPSASAKLGELAGVWEQQHVQGLEPYLKRLGVGWPQRQAALSFAPKQAWTIEAGVPKMTMASPLGVRVEQFPLGEAHEEKDLNGRSFMKTSSWEKGMLVARSRAVEESMPEIVARRWIDSNTGALVQETSFDGVVYTRIFVHKE
mmetsp:Transcript_27371/g.67992  ORF Transcript_27371/g.67992 Transcript_27371/m.67992 type:complete len:345 (+) Transcript_27371:199-1233(+)